MMQSQEEAVVAAAAQDTAEPRFATAHRIRSLAIVGGFLDGIAIDLSAGLNCLIGARGAGKTTVLELVRYALDALPGRDDSDRRRIESLVEANLGKGHVRVEIETPDGLVYVVTRTADAEPVITTPTGAPTELSLRGGSVFRAEFFSQNEIERIANRSLSQLSLIDQFEAVAIADAADQIQTVVHKLTMNEGKLQPLAGKIEALASEVNQLGGVEERLKELAPAAGEQNDEFEQAQKAKTLRDQERRALDAAWQFLDGYDQEIEAVEGQMATKLSRLLPDELMAGVNASSMSELRDRMLARSTEIDRLLQQARTEIAGARDDLGEVGVALTDRHGEQEQAYQQVLQRNEQLRGQAAERVKLEQQRSALQAKRRQRDELVQQIRDLQQERTALIAQLSELRDQRFAIRQAVVDRINGALCSHLRVTIEQAGHLGSYQQMIEAALKGSRVRGSLVAQKLVESMSPTELVEAVRGRDADGIRERAGLNADQARRTLDALDDDEVLLGLETVELADRPRIELKDGDRYKESTTLSTGQKCTAILPILLLENDAPLLIDQPEDNLDNRFICDFVVRNISAAKLHRQLIFVTHNPNIPVLGEAERVFVLESNGSQSLKRAEGDVDACKDAIVNLLEGGEDAFRRRRERYAY